MYSFYIDAVAIHNQDRGTNTKEETEDDKDASLPSTKGFINFNMKDYEAISVRNRNQYSLLRELLLLCQTYFPRKSTMSPICLRFWLPLCVHQFLAMKLSKLVFQRFYYFSWSFKKNNFLT